MSFWRIEDIELDSKELQIIYVRNFASFKGESYLDPNDIQLLQPISLRPAVGSWQREERIEWEREILLSWLQICATVLSRVINAQTKNKTLNRANVCWRCQSYICITGLGEIDTNRIRNILTNLIDVLILSTNTFRQVRLTY